MAKSSGMILAIETRNIIENSAAMTSKKRNALKQIRVSLLFAAFILSSTAPRVIELEANNLGGKSGEVFRDCPGCPEMVVVPAGSFSMGSSESEKAWAASHGASAESVSDEAPQHHVTLKSFALGKYDVTRAEYAVFVHEIGYPPCDGCGKDSFKWNKQPDLNWQN